jgi:hypothetical protein
VAKSWPNPTLSFSRSRDLSAPSIHFEYSRKSMFELVSLIGVMEPGMIGILEPVSEG